MKRSLLNEWKVDGKSMLDPDEGIAVKKRNVESGDSGNDEGGYYHPINLRTDVYQWDFTYSCLTNEEYNYLEGLFKGKDEFEFTYLDDADNASVCIARRSGSSSVRKDRRTKQYRNYTISIIQN